PGSAPRSLAAFQAFAERRGWQLAVTGASAGQLTAYRQLGLRVLRVGEEAIVDVAGFSLEGRAIRKVRQSVSRARRHGWSMDVVRARDLDPADARAAAPVEAGWAAAHA